MSLRRERILGTRLLCGKRGVILSDHASEESAFVFRREKKQILRFPTPATAKAAVAGVHGTLRMTLMRCYSLRKHFLGTALFQLHREIRVTLVARVEGNGTLFISGLDIELNWLLGVVW